MRRVVRCRGGRLGREAKGELVRLGRREGLLRLLKVLQKQAIMQSVSTTDPA